MDEPRLFLIDTNTASGPAEWVLTEETRLVGRRGVADARVALQQAAACRSRQQAEAA